MTVTISVLTATYNCAAQLPALIQSLRGQSDRDFEWVIADGASTDATLEQLAAAADLRPRIFSQPDFGIYDALNRAVRNATADYYIVVGADDEFQAHAIANFRAAILQSAADVVVANAMYGKYCFKVKRGPSWLVADKSFIVNHSLATAFRRDLHARFGFYSRKFPIAADSLFVLLACRGGATRYEAGFVAGRIGGGGVSSADWLGSATELFRVQVSVGCAFIPQLGLFLLRILKGSSTRMRTLHNALFR
jgi:glycosyltransferase involved in cell wall biosynthesis